MHPFPHRYAVVADATPEGEITLAADDLQALRSAAPVEFDGPGRLWSPEHLIVAAVADCFVLTFQGIVRKSRLPWISVTCKVAGTLERIDNVTRFTAFDIRPHLYLPDDIHIEQARRILVRAEETCLITRSLNAAINLHSRIEAPEVIAAR